MRLALIQLNPTIGALDANRALMRAALTPAADLILFPELCLCGYPPRDLLLQQGFLAACAAAAAAFITDAARVAPSATVIFGLPITADSPLRTRARALAPGYSHARDADLLGPGSAAITNSLVAARGGHVIAVYDKQLLPTYDVFDEDRYFTPGAEPRVITVPTAAGAPVRVGLTICEDLWKGEDAGFAAHYQLTPCPVAAAVRAGAQVIVSASASPFVLGKHARHQAILRRHAATHQVVVASTNQVGGNDELIFDGRASAFAPGGALLAEAAAFAPDVLTLDLAPHLVPHTDRTAPSQPTPNAPSTAAHALADPLPAQDAELFSALVLGIRDYCRKTGFRSVVLGLSGGIDSAVTAALAAAALGPANVTGILMPGPYSSDHSLTDARALADALTIPHLTIPIAAPVDAFRSALDAAFTSRDLASLGAALPDLTEENLQSRVRGTTLMAWSNRTGALVLTTGNKSELAVGYCTLYGDMNGGLAVLSDCTKQLVYRLARYMNAHHAACGFRIPPIPEASITKPPSAELRPNQTDQDSLPPYDVLDEIISRYVEARHDAAAIIAAGFDEPTVRRILRLIDLSEYKRKQAAIGLKVTGVAFGSGRRWPIAQGWRP